MDTIKVTEYDTFSLRPDVQDMSGMRFHDMYLCISGLFELKQMVAAAHAGLRGGQGSKFSGFRPEIWGTVTALRVWPGLGGG